MGARPWSPSPWIMASGARPGQRQAMTGHGSNPLSTEPIDYGRWTPGHTDDMCPQLWSRPSMVSSLAASTTTLTASSSRFRTFRRPSPLSAVPLCLSSPMAYLHVPTHSTQLATARLVVPFGGFRPFASTPHDTWIDRLIPAPSWIETISSDLTVCWT